MEASEPSRERRRVVDQRQVQAAVAPSGERQRLQGPEERSVGDEENIGAVSRRGHCAVGKPELSPRRYLLWIERAAWLSLVITVVLLSAGTPDQRGTSSMQRGANKAARRRDPNATRPARSASPAHPPRQWDSQAGGGGAPEAGRPPPQFGLRGKRPPGKRQPGGMYGPGGMGGTPLGMRQRPGKPPPRQFMVPELTSAQAPPGPALPSDQILVVIARYCEPIDWWIEWNISIIVYEKKPGCVPDLVASVAKRNVLGLLPAEALQLKNMGREGQTYMRYVLDHYEGLRKYTVFAQGAGQHNGISVRATVEYFVAGGYRQAESGQQALFPIVRYRNGNPILYRDADEYEFVGIPQDEYEKWRVGVNRDNNLVVFNFLHGQAISDRARVLYVSLFGGNTCDTPPMVFSAGAQMIVHRDAILSKPLYYWEQLEVAVRTCHPLGWDLERLWLHVFDPARTPLSEDDMKIPCLPGPGHLPEWRHFKCERYADVNGNWKLPTLPAATPAAPP